MDNNFNNDNVQPNQVPNPEQNNQGRDFSAQFAQYNQPKTGFDNQNPDANPYQQPVQPDYNQYQPQQPDYNQYQPQQPVQPDYNQYQPQQPDQPDYNQYQPQQPAQPDYNQYQPQQPAQPDYNQYQPQQPAQPDYYNQYQNNPVQPYDYNQAGYQQPDYQQGNIYNPAPAEGPTGAAKAFSIVALVCGIVSVVFGCCGWGMIFGIPGAVFGIISKAKCGAKNPLALVGMILSFVGIGLSIIMIVVMCVSGSSSYSTPYSSFNW